MPLTVEELRDEISHHIQDPARTLISDGQLLEFINSAAWDAANKGWLVDLQDDESLYLATSTFEYAVPASFAYIHEIWEEGDATDVGSNLNEALDTSETDVDVVNGTLYAVGDRIRIDSEWMQVTAVVANVLTVTRGVLGTIAATHTSGTAIFRGPGTYNRWLPWSRWQIKRGLSNSPVIWFDNDLFTITVGHRLRVLGQSRPTTEYGEDASIDTGMESFIRERAVAYAARNLSRSGSQHAQTFPPLGAEAYAASEDLLQQQAELFRPKRYSRVVPGR